MDAAAATLRSSGDAKALRMLTTIVTNISSQPEEQKFRELRVSNAKIAALLAVPGEVENSVGTYFTQ